MKILRSTIKDNLDELILHNPTDEFVFTVPKDPFLSPYWADDEMLKKVPPMKILVKIILYSLLHSRTLANNFFV